jgi:hypothetical protein
MLRSIPSQTESQCSRWEHQDAPPPRVPCTGRAVAGPRRDGRGITGRMQERRSVFEPATGRLKSSFRESISRYRVSGNLVLRHRLGELLKSHAGSEVCAEVENGQGKEVSPVFGAGTVLLPDPRPGRSPGRKHPRPQVSSPAVARGERADRPVGLISGDSVQVNSIQYCQSCFRSVRFADCRSVSSSRA